MRPPSDQKKDAKSPLIFFKESSFAIPLPKYRFGLYSLQICIYNHVGIDLSPIVHPPPAKDKTSVRRCGGGVIKKGDKKKNKNGERTKD